MITREQVADLQPGDVVELHRQGWAKDVVVRGSILGDTCIGELYLGDYSLVSATGQAPVWLEFPDSTLTVVSRAPRPLYVNHPRTEPVQHDVVRDGEGAIRHCDAKGFGGKPTWWGFGNVAGCKWTHTTYPPQPLTLLVDGSTGEVVP